MSTPQELTQELIDLANKHFLPVYAPAPMILSQGSGARVQDLCGKEYIDLGAGIAVNALGHCDGSLSQTLNQQAGKLWHTSNLYFHEQAIRLAEELCRETFAQRVFFTNSGAEANETAIKVARKYSSLLYPEDKREIITFYGSFHGRTLATITATAQPKYQQGFEPLPGGFRYCPFNDVEALKNIISEKTCAVMLEPIQGEGGVNPAQPGFLTEVDRLCKQHNALLILDEIQTGIGRTGKLFAYEWESEVKPDIVTLAKSLGGGLPLGAMLTTENVGEKLKPGDHGSTFGGNPVVTAVARHVLRVVREPEFLQQVQAMGQRLLESLQQVNKEFPVFESIRGRGMMLGGVLKPSCADQAAAIRQHCMEQGVLVLQAGPGVMRFLPALNITGEELEEGIQRFRQGLKSFLAAAP